MEELVLSFAGALAVILVAGAGFQWLEDRFGDRPWWDTLDRRGPLLAVPVIVLAGVVFVLLDSYLTENPTVSGKSLDAWIAELKAPEARPREEAARALVSVLQDTRQWTDVRLKSLTALKDADASTGTGGGLSGTLRRLTLGDNYALAAAACSALEQIRDHETVDTLLRLLESDSCAATVVLGKFGDARAIAPLLEKLQKYGAGPGVPPPLELREALARIAARDTGAFYSHLRSSDPLVRREVVLALSTVCSPGHGDATGPLLDAAGDSDRWVRIHAATALGKVGDRRAVPALVALLGDRDDGVVEAGVDALAPFSDSSATAELARLVNSSRNQEIQHKAIAALGRIGEPAMKPLLDLLVLPERHQECAEIVTALSAVKHQAVVDAVLVRLTDPVCNKAAARGLERLGWEPASGRDITHVLVAHEDGAALRKDWDRTLKVLLQDVESPDRQVVDYALYSFVQLGVEGTIKLLIETLEAKGSKTMAEAFLNCGNSELSSAATQWARERGYTIVRGQGSRPVAWGAWR